MSTNKAQGQTLDFVGVHLPDHVFTHGQLYVAFSRVRNAKALAVHLNNKEGYTKTLFTKKFFESFHKYDNNGFMNMNVEVK